MGPMDRLLYFSAAPSGLGEVSEEVLLALASEAQEVVFRARPSMPW